MNNQDEIKEWLKLILHFVQPDPKVREKVESALNMLTLSPAEGWRSASEIFYKEAIDALSNNDSTFYLVISGACLGHSVTLARIEKEANARTRFIPGIS